MPAKTATKTKKAAPNKQELLDLYRTMKLIRLFEETAGQQYMHGKIRGFLHLYIGQEAIAAGAISVLSPEDYVYTHYRDHGHALAKGINPNAAMAELFGRTTGCSKGKGGSMHLFDRSINFMGGYAIVGGQIPLATGQALANKYREDGKVVVCFVGDGALSEGEFHEAVNLSRIWELPIIFYCENNLYGMGASVSEVFAAKDIYKIVEPYGMPSSQVDGMDVLAVREHMQGVLEYVRDGNGPYFVEALAYRFRGHSMADPNEYRDREEEAFWKERDPITNYREKLLGQKSAAEKDLDAIDEEVERIVDEAVEFANNSPEPELSDLYNDIIGA
ncbi:MAG: pyruvate dehydrogenase (acetyl-transferring) E1 component subunit alpha [Dehalococcoidia bacterium]